MKMTVRIGLGLVVAGMLFAACDPTGPRMPDPKVPEEPTDSIPPGTAALFAPHDLT
jgi:hypothetical protein